MIQIVAHRPGDLQAKTRVDGQVGRDVEVILAKKGVVVDAIFVIRNTATAKREEGAPSSKFWKSEHPSTPHKPAGSGEGAEGDGAKNSSPLKVCGKFLSRLTRSYGAPKRMRWVPRVQLTVSSQV